MTEQILVTNAGDEISLEKGAKMVKDHHDKLGESNSHQYVFGKSLLEKIIAQPGCEGIRMFDAVNENGVKSLVFVGVDKNGIEISEYPMVNENGKLNSVDGIVGTNIVLFTPTLPGRW